MRGGESTTALSQLYKALEYHSFNDYELTIVDVTKDPESKESQGISNTPALLKHLDSSNVHYAGNFADFERMRQIFGFKAAPSDICH